MVTNEKIKKKAEDEKFKKKALENPDSVENLSIFGKIKLTLMLSMKERKFLWNYHTGRVDEDNTPFPAEKVTKNLRPRRLAFLIASGILYIVYLIGVFILPDFSSSPPLVAVYIFRIACALGFSVITGWLLTPLILKAPHLDLNQNITMWANVAAFFGFVAWFTWLFSGKIWAAATLGNFALANLAAFPSTICAYPLIWLATFSSKH